MNYNILIILLIIIIIFFYSNKLLQNNKEHFTELLSVFNNLMNNTNKKNNNIKNENNSNKNNSNENNSNEIIKQENIENLFKKNIFVIYNQQSNNNFELYFYNYKNQLYMKCKITKNSFLLKDKNNKLLGSLINNMYQSYKFNLHGLYDENIYYFSFLKNYDNIKIFPENEKYNLYIKKYNFSKISNKHLLYTLYYFEKKNRAYLYK